MQGNGDNTGFRLFNAKKIVEQDGGQMPVNLAFGLGKSLSYQPFRAYISRSKVTKGIKTVGDSGDVNYNRFQRLLPSRQRGG
jgi:hypothetical protein